MTKVTIDRELLERIARKFSVKPYWDSMNQGQAIAELRAILAAPRQPEGDYGWLVNLELPEVQCNCPWNPDSHDKTCPVYLRDRLSDAQRAIAELRGLVPELPPRPPEGDGMPRYGLRWNGPRQPVSVPMADGYWTPWHLAEAECERLRKDAGAEMFLTLTGEITTLRQQLAELRAQLLAIASAEPGRHNIEWAKAMAATGNNEAYAKWREAFDQRDKLAWLLADVKADYTHAIHWEDMHATMKRIDAALAEVNK